MSEPACKRCQRPIEAGQDRCGCGVALPKNSLAVRHGGRRNRRLTQQEARSSELYQEWAQDLGGLESLSVAQREVLAGVVAACFVRATAEKYLASSSFSLVSDKAQRALQVFHRADEAVRRGAQVLGIERRSKQVPTTVAAIVAHLTEQGRG